MNHERKGLALFERTLEEVAVDLESPRRAPRLLWAVAAGLAVLALIVVPRFLPLEPAPEVEILELRVGGRPVQARLEPDVAPGTILVLPEEQRALSALAVGASR